MRFVREPAHRGQAAARGSPSSSPRPTTRDEAGEDLLEYVAKNPGVDLATVLAEWQAKIAEGGTGDDVGTLDIVPHNLILGADGTLRIIDVELVGSVAHGQIVRRGLFWMAHHVARASAGDRWGKAQTVRDVAVQLGVAAGLDERGDWLELALIEELGVQVEVQNGPQLGLTDEQWANRFEAEMRRGLDRRLADLPLGDRLPDRYRALEEQAAAARVAADATAQRLQDAIAGVRAELSAAEARYQELLNSRAVKLANKYRRGLEVALPAGTARREMFRWATGGPRRDEEPLD